MTSEIGKPALVPAKVDATAPVAKTTTLANFLNDNAGHGFSKLTGTINVSSGGVITLTLQPVGDAGRSLSVTVVDNAVKEVA